MYSDQCKTCIVEGCPDSCKVKQDYHRDLVRVIRCKDCKNWDRDWLRDDPDYHYCSVVDKFVKQDFYCGAANKE